ncbi:MAG: protein kinase [Anaerolineales bacterium]|nr:MAG: protein kinase [Anaerolineales bacterium]
MVQFYSIIMSDRVALNNRYQLEERLGSGGMAVVYRAQDLMLERDVAIKILRESYLEDPAFQERFRQEAKAAANLSHPNIVTVHDFGLDRGRLFIVMEFVPGAHLKSILQRQGNLPIAEAISILIQACAGIGYAHRAGLVHCDIKPHNILITPDKRVKVTDFGIARLLASIQPGEHSEVVWGSPQYFSPEQASGGAPSLASDVYSLGVILYELLTGRLPFYSEDATELARLHRETPPPPPSKFNSAIPPALEQILLKVLAKDPALRFRNADQLGRVLVSYQTANQFAETNLPADGPPSQIAPAPNPRSRPIQIARVSQPAPAVTRQEQPSRPVHTAPPKQDSNPLEIDWVTVGLGLLTLLAVGGLVPLYLWIYFLYFQ